MAPLWTVSSNTNLAGMHPTDRQAVIYGHAEQHRGDVATESLAQEHWSKTVTRSNHTELLCFFWDTHLRSDSADSLQTFWWVTPAQVAIYSGIFTPSLGVILPVATLHKNIH